MNLDFWKGRRVLITGQTGFKGGWLAFWLAKSGARVFGYGLPPSDPSFYNICNVSAMITSYYGDILNTEYLEDIIALARPSVVIHLAAQALVCESYLDPIGTFRINILGTANLLDILRFNPDIKSILVITSDKCYNNQISSIHKETDELGGIDPYSASKACTELLVNSYRQSFFKSIPIATARAGNVIGGGDWAPDRLVPDVVRAITQEETLNLRNPRCARPWQYILDVLSGYLDLAERLVIYGNEYAEAWNFGPSGDPILVHEFIDLFLSEWGGDKTWIDTSSARKYDESKILRLDCTKALERLKWIPRLELLALIKQTVEWYKAYNSGYDMQLYTNKQIEEYMKL